jgi:hypothetical protein
VSDIDLVHVIEQRVDHHEPGDLSLRARGDRAQQTRLLSG